MPLLHPVTGHPFGLGAKLDTPHRRRLYGRALGPGGLFETTPTLVTGTVSLAEYEALVLDQGRSSGCEGESGAMATWMDLAAAGSPLPFFPSGDGIYRDARCFDRVPNADGSLPPLTDTGTMTSSVLQALPTCGVRAATGPAPDGRNSDLDPATLNDEPRLDQLDTEAEAPVLVDPGAFAVDLADTKEALSVIQAALDADHPVRIDIFCDSAFQAFFQSWTSGTAPLSSCNLSDPNGGGHAIVLAEIAVAADGTVKLAGLNSWGELGAPPLVAAGANLKAGHWQGDAAWFAQAVQQATVWACKRVQS